MSVRLCVICLCVTSVSTRLDKGKFVSVMKHYAMIGSGVIVPQFLTSVLDGGEWSVSRPTRLTPEKKMVPTSH
jgi:hypothetical protein